MSNYNSNFTDELRERLSIVDVVGKRVPLTKKGQNFWGCCPFHNEKTPSFSVNEERGRYHCFGCGEDGDIISFTMKSNNMDFMAAIKELAQQAGIKMPDYKPKSNEERAREESYVDITTAASKTYQQKLFESDGAHALEYIKNRGFSEETIKKYGIGYAPKNNIISAKFANTPFDKLSATGLVRRGEYGNYDFFREKLMFPIFNASGQVVAFSGRSLDGSEPKYINTVDTELFHKRKTIFGLNFAREFIHKNNRSIVVEGQIDAIQMQNHGFGETVAPLGTALTEDHIAILCKLNRNIVFCFDGDAAGQKAAMRALDIVAPFLRDTSDIRFAFMSGGKDPDEVLKSKDGIKSMKKIIDSAQPLLDFFWFFINKNFNTVTPNGKSQAEKWIEKWLKKITDFKFQEILKTEINNLIWQNWKKIKNKKETEAEKLKSIQLPTVDNITANTLQFIIDNYPELAEIHADFLTTLDLSTSSSGTINLDMNLQDAEKFIVSLKLTKYLEKLQNDKRNLTMKLLSGDESVREKISGLDAEIKKSTNRLNSLNEI